MKAAMGGARERERRWTQIEIKTKQLNEKWTIIMDVVDELGKYLTFSLLALNVERLQFSANSSRNIRFLIWHLGVLNINELN